MQLSVCQLGVSVLLFRTEDDSICICLRLRQYNQSTKKILSEILWRKKRYKNIKKRYGTEHRRVHPPTPDLSPSPDRYLGVLRSDVRMW